MKRTMNLHVAILVAIMIVVIFNTQLVLSLLNGIVIRSSGGIGPISPLHVEGKYVKDSDGNTVFLRGTVKHGFEDFPEASWQRQDGGINYGSTDYSGANWDPTVVAANLDAMKSWGMNIVRMYTAAEWWINNTGNHRQIVKDIATMCAARGMYFMYEGYIVLHGAAQTPLPYPPHVEPNPYFNSEADFVTYMQSIANELKGYPNILFGLWNEPHPASGQDAAASRAGWFSVVQQCIDAIRATGATNIIVPQWNYDIGVNLNYPPPAPPTPYTPTSALLDWIYLFPLDDPLGNIVYSTHLYRGSIAYTEPARINVWTYDDIKLSFQLCWVDYVLNTLNKPLIMFEIGVNSWATGDELLHEYDFYKNCLQRINELEMGYLGFWWWPLGRHPHLTTQPNYQPNEVGGILRSALQ